MNKLLLILFFLAAAIRIYGLSIYPSGLNADEAALGYNAFSLLLTGRDEHGHLFPVNLESFGDFKPALYSYLLVPLIKFLGLTVWSVRLPSAIFGAFSVILVYFLTRLIFPSKKSIALIAALMLSLNPWAIHFSRGAWEVNLATTLLLLGVVSFLKKSYGLFALSFILSLYTYQSARVIAPVLGSLLILVYRVKIKPFLPYLLLLLPLAISVISSDASSRLAGVGLLADEGPLNRVKELRGQHSSDTYLISKFAHNRPVIYSIQYLSNYLDHFDGNFLFVNGDIIARNKVPETGLFYFTDLFLLIIGVVMLFRSSSPHKNVIWLWLIVAPIASALTFQTPHALRAHNLLIPLLVLMSLGMASLLKYKFITFIFIIISLWNFSRFWHEYTVHYPRTYPDAWQYGFDQVVDYAQSQKDKFSDIYITDKYDQPYILFLFYSRYDPQLFQSQHTLTFRDKYNFSTVRSYGKFHFTSTNWDLLRDKHSSLIIAAPEDIPQVGVNVVKTISFPNGQPAFKIIAN